MKQPYATIACPIKHVSAAIEDGRCSACGEVMTKRTDDEREGAHHLRLMRTVVNVVVARLRAAADLADKANEPYDKLLLEAAETLEETDRQREEWRQNYIRELRRRDDGVSSPDKTTVTQFSAS